MKAFVTAVALFHLAFPIWAIGQSPAARGCVVYKRDSEAWASLEEYRSYEDRGTNIMVTDAAGKEFRLFWEKEPIFIPYPTDTSADREKANAQIRQARKRYPELTRRLAAVEKAWAAAPRKAVAAVASAPVATVAPAPTVRLGMEIVTTTGKKYENVTISRIEPDGLMVMTDAGVEKVPFVDLSPEMQKMYGYNPVAAADFIAARAVAQQQRAQQAAIPLPDRYVIHMGDTPDMYFEGLAPAANSVGVEMKWTIKRNAKVQTRAEAERTVEAMQKVAKAGGFYAPLKVEPTE